MSITQNAKIAIDPAISIPGMHARGGGTAAPLSPRLGRRHTPDPNFGATLVGIRCAAYDWPIDAP
ncbi:MAG TPA: hypothetical protein VFO73_12905 [Candidatus Limnocylindrales bacterium]|nr:hypothetical protein [Candidatus Limnocylindrales bacterium]